MTPKVTKTIFDDTCHLSAVAELVVINEAFNAQVLSCSGSEIPRVQGFTTT